MHCMNDFGEEQLNLNQMINNKTHNPFVIRKNGSVLFSLVLNKMTQVIIYSYPVTVQLI